VVYGIRVTLAIAAVIFGGLKNAFQIGFVQTQSK
jgi:hypothetical protein